MRQHSYATVKDDTKVSYRMTLFDDLRPDRHGGGSWRVTMFGVETTTQREAIKGWLVGRWIDLLND